MCAKHLGGAAPESALEISARAQEPTPATRRRRRRIVKRLHI